MHYRCRNTVVALVVAAGAVVCGAQEQGGEGSSFFRGSRFFYGLHGELWLTKEYQTLEAVVPLYYSMALDRLLEGLAFDLVTSPTFAVSGAGLASEAGEGLFAVAGTKLRVSYNIGNVVLSTVGVQVPTGSSAVSSRETGVLGDVAVMQRSFRVSRVQTGFDVDATVATSFTLGDRMTVGGGAGFLMHGPYTPIENENKYNPGNEINVNAGIDITTTGTNAELKWLSDFGVTFYTADRADTGSTKTNDIKVFRSGTRFSINTRLSAATTSGTKNILAVNVNLFGKNKILVDDSLAQENKETDAFVVTDYLYFARKSAARPYILGKGSFFTPNFMDAGRAAIGGAGAGLVVGVTRRTSLKGQAVVEAGSMNGEFLMGVELNGGIHHVF